MLAVLERRMTGHGAGLMHGSHLRAISVSGALLLAGTEQVGKDAIGSGH